MANLIFSQKSVGAKVFSGRLQNISDPDAPVDLSLDGADSFFVLFRSPTGEEFERTATVNTEDSIPSNDMDITYVTTPDDTPYASETGRWAYTVGVLFSNKSKVVSPYWEEFWVMR